MNLKENIAAVVDSASTNIKEKNRVDFGDVQALQKLKDMTAETQETQIMLGDIKKDLSDMLTKKGLTLEGNNGNDMTHMLKAVLGLVSNADNRPITYEQIDPNTSLTDLLDSLIRYGYSNISVIFSNGEEHEQPGDEPTKQTGDKILAIYNAGDLISVIKKGGLYIKHTSDANLFQKSSEEQWDNFDEGTFYLVDNNMIAHDHGDNLNDGFFCSVGFNNTCLPEKTQDLNHVNNNTFDPKLTNATENISKIIYGKQQLEELSNKIIGYRNLGLSYDLQKANELLAKQPSNSDEILEIGQNIETEMQKLSTLIASFETQFPIDTANQISRLDNITLDKGFLDNLVELKEILDILDNQNIFPNQKATIETSVIVFKAGFEGYMDTILTSVARDQSGLDKLNIAREVIQLFSEATGVFASLTYAPSLEQDIDITYGDIEKEIKGKQVENLLSTTVTSLTSAERQYLGTSKISTIPELEYYLENHTVPEVGSWNTIEISKDNLTAGKTLFEKLNTINGLGIFIDDLDTQLSTHITEFTSKLENIEAIIVYKTAKQEFISTLKNTGDIDVDNVKSLETHVATYENIRKDFEKTLGEIVIVHIGYLARNYDAYLAIENNTIVLSNGTQASVKLLDPYIYSIISSQVDLNKIKNYGSNGVDGYKKSDIVDLHNTQLDNLAIADLKNDKILEIADITTWEGFQKIHTTNSWHEVDSSKKDEQVYTTAQKQDILDIIYPLEKEYIRALGELMFDTTGKNKFNPGQQTTLGSIIRDILPFQTNNISELKTYIENTTVNKIQKFNLDQLKHLEGIMNSLDAQAKTLELLGDEIYKKETLKDITDAGITFITGKNIYDLFNIAGFPEDDIQSFRDNILSQVTPNTSVIEKIADINNGFDTHPTFENKFLRQAILELLFTPAQLGHTQAIREKVQNNTLEYNTHKQAKYIRRLLDKEQGNFVSLDNVVIRMGGDIGTIGGEAFTSELNSDGTTLLSNLNRDISIEILGGRDINIIYNDKTMLQQDSISQARKIIQTLISHSYGEIQDSEIPTELQ